jgi:hypothetical protein
MRKNRIIIQASENTMAMHKLFSVIIKYRKGSGRNLEDQKAGCSEARPCKYDKWYHAGCVSAPLDRQEEDHDLEKGSVQDCMTLGEVKAEDS